MTERTAKSFLMIILVIVGFLIACKVVNKNSDREMETFQEAQTGEQSSSSTSPVYTFSTNKGSLEETASSSDVETKQEVESLPPQGLPEQALTLFFEQIELESKLMNETNADEKSALRSQIETVKNNRLSIYRSNQ